VIIVMGVLIALAAQSWWENRAVEEDRVRTLELLLDDVSRLEASLRDSLNADSVTNAIEDLLAGRFAESDEDLSDQISDALWDFGFDIGPRDGEDLLPAYADLKGSGRLALLSDSVRSRMPAIELQLAVLSRFLDDIVYHQQSRIDRILYENFDIRPAADASGGDFAVAAPRSNLEVFRDREVRNLLVLKGALIEGQLAEWKEAADSLVVLRELLRGELGGS
jgi:hypothetical protein